MGGIAQSESDVLVEARPGSRGRLVRRVVLFQIKLMADGFRDVVMSPLSIAAAVLGILSPHRNAEAYLDRLMSFGRETDHWINLFDHRGCDEAGDARGLDRVADDIERAVRRDYERGGLSAKSAEALTELALHLRRRARRS